MDVLGPGPKGAACHCPRLNAHVSNPVPFRVAHAANILHVSPPQASKATGPSCTPGIYTAPLCKTHVKGCAEQRAGLRPVVAPCVTQCVWSVGPQAPTHTVLPVRSTGTNSGPGATAHLSRAELPGARLQETNQMRARQLVPSTCVLTGTSCNPRPGQTMHPDLAVIPPNRCLAATCWRPGPSVQFMSYGALCLAFSTDPNHATQHACSQRMAAAYCWEQCMQ